MKAINAYLTFDGNCLDAMKFYQRCLGGDLQLTPFSDAPGNHPKGAKDRIIHARLTQGGAVLMASGSISGMPLQRGGNFSVAVQYETGTELEKLFNTVGEKGKVVLPLQDTFWGGHFGMLTDQFGINWMFNLQKE